MNMILEIFNKIPVMVLLLMSATSVIAGGFLPSRYDALIKKGKGLEPLE